MIQNVHANAPLHPDAVEILDTLRANGVPEWHTLSPDRAREVYDARVGMFASVRTPIREVRDHEISTAAGPLRVRLYDATAGGDVSPAFVYLHGGGWTLGNLDSHDELCRRLSVATGAKVLAVDYRLAPEHPYPAPLQDCLAAIRWIADHADALGVDAGRLAVGGDSAGGNLAAGACLWIRDHGGPRLAAQVLLYPGIAPAWENLSFYENAVGKFLTRRDVQWFWANYLGGASPTDPYAVPGAAKLADLPPALIVTAGHDPLRDDGEIYGHRLAEAGNDVSIRRYDGMIHGFLGLPVELDDARDAIAAVADMLAGAWRTTGE